MLHNSTVRYIHVKHCICNLCICNIIIRIRYHVDVSQHVVRLSMPPSSWDREIDPADMYIVPLNPSRSVHCNGPSQKYCALHLPMNYNPKLFSSVLDISLSLFVPYVAAGGEGFRDTSLKRAARATYMMERWASTPPPTPQWYGSQILGPPAGSSVQQCSSLQHQPEAAACCRSLQQRFATARDHNESLQQQSTAADARATISPSNGSKQFPGFSMIFSIFL